VSAWRTGSPKGSSHLHKNENKLRHAMLHLYQKARLNIAQLLGVRKIFGFSGTPAKAPEPVKALLR